MNEQHKDKFRGWFIPLQVCRLFESRTLNAEEILLLVKIDCLQDEENGDVCWASNDYLGRWWGKSGRWVRSTTAKFEKLGLIKITQLGDGRRHLKSLLFRRNETSRGVEENFQSRRNETSTKLPLREREEQIQDTTGEAGSGLFDLIPPENRPVKFSPPVIQFANWSRKKLFHIRIPGTRPSYKKGGGANGWSYETLLRWEDVYKGMLKSLSPGEIIKTLSRFINWEKDSEYAPVIHTFPSFAEKYDRVLSFVKRERARRERAGEDPDEFEYPEVRETIINPGNPHYLTAEEHAALKAEVDGPIRK